MSAHCPIPLIKAYMSMFRSNKWYWKRDSAGIIFKRGKGDHTGKNSGKWFEGEREPA